MTFIAWTITILFSFLPFKTNMFFALFLYHIFRFEFCIILLDSQAIATSELTHLHIAFSATSCPVRLFFAWKQGRPDAALTVSWMQKKKGNFLFIANLRFKFLKIYM